jgi:hypothetical protein
MASLVPENGRTFLRGDLLDCGATLGSAAIKPRERWEGYEGTIEPPKEILKRIAALGFRVPDWRTMEFYESRSVGRFPASHDQWDPRAWRAHLNISAFHHAREDDRFWAAQKLVFITDEIIDAAVAEGRFGDALAEKALAGMIKQRRDRILQTYLPAVNPIVEPSLANGMLTFRNAAVDAKVAAPVEGYTAEWASFDNATGAATPLATTRSGGSPLPAPQLPATGFIQVRVSANNAPNKTWNEPVSIFFRRTATGWQLVGLERTP